MIGKFAQELLSTFSTSLGEVALVPCTGGTFVVSITAVSASASASGAEGETEVKESVLWDRRVDGGFPGMYSLFYSLLFLRVGQ